MFERPQPASIGPWAVGRLGEGQAARGRAVSAATAVATARIDSRLGRAAARARRRTRSRARRPVRSSTSRCAWLPPRRCASGRLASSTIASASSPRPNARSARHAGGRYGASSRRSGSAATARRDDALEALGARVVARADEREHRVHVGEAAESVGKMALPGIGEMAPARARDAAAQLDAPEQRGSVDQVRDLAWPGGTDMQVV